MARHESGALSVVLVIVFAASPRLEIPGCGSFKQTWRARKAALHDDRQVSFYGQCRYTSSQGREAEA